MKKGLLALLVFSLIAALGYTTGRRVTIAPIERQLSENRQNTLSGGVSLAEVFATDEKRKEASACFLDGPAAASRFQDFSWAPPVVPVPFVGFGPRPGRHLDCFVTPLLLRSERDPVSPKPAGVKRVFVVGGSVAFGSGAPSQDRTIGAYLELMATSLLRGTDEGRFRSCEVFTLAYPWWTSTHERILVENRVAALEPDLVLVLSGVNDVREALLGKDVRWMRTRVDDFFFERLSQDHALAGFPLLEDAVPAAKTPPTPEQVAERIAANLSQEEHAVPGKLRFLLQPTIFGTKKPLTPREKAIRDDPGNAAARDYFEKAYAAIRAIPAVGDATDAFDAASDDVFLDTAHCADRGNELLARRLAAFVR
jgi:hypothetical protein